MTTPLIILSDAPTAPTGLGRITRELALRIHENMSDVFDVATFGFGGTVSKALPYTQYPMTTATNYVPVELPKVWNDFVGEGEGEGIILAIWNPSWAGFLAQPDKLPASGLRDFVESKPFKSWGYFPVDGDGPNGTLPESIKRTMQGFDRVLAYTRWAAEVMERTLSGSRVVEALPHGLDTSVFYRRDYVESRRVFVEKVKKHEPAPLNPDIFLVGVVATNSPRKDWYLAFEACAELMRGGVNVGMWAHTDAWRKHWDLQSLAEEFGKTGRVMFTNHYLSDEEMAVAYSACDVTFGIGLGEGWGYPLAESLACGTPVVHGDYAGGAEFVPRDFLVEPVAFRGDGYFGIRRPVFDAAEWAKTAFDAAKRNSPVSLPTYIDWDNAWPKWQEWLSGGLDDRNK